MRLWFRATGQGGQPLVLVHGLFGAATNWGRVARHLQGDFHLYLPDLRNHGRSPWAPRMDYDAMAEDLAALLDTLGLEQAWWLGHSMGGKAVMRLALRRPDRVRGLILADIAPIPYADHFTPLFEALQALPLARLKDRRQADAWLARSIGEPAVRAYLLQNLVRDGGGWRWRCNLAALRAHLPELLAAPTDRARPYEGPTLLIRGGRSDYVSDSAWTEIRRWFPQARLHTLEGAGHWLYSERPEAFSQEIRKFILRSA